MTRCGRGNCRRDATHVITAGRPGHDQYKMAVACSPHIEPTRRWATSAGIPIVTRIGGDVEPAQPALFEEHT